jgi:hypothetical protein
MPDDEALDWPEEPEGEEPDPIDDNDPTPRRSHFWRRFGIPWAWGAHHMGTTRW